MASKEEIQVFRNDFVPLLKICRRMSGGFRDEHLNNQNLAIIKKYAEDFSRKYKTLQIRVEKCPYDMPRLAILLRDEKDFYNVFFTVEKIIPKVARAIFVYNGKYRNVSITEFRLRFEEFKPHMVKGNVYFEYTREKVIRKVKLCYRKDYGAIQVFEDDFMVDENDPEFLLCMHYAFDKGYDPDIDLSKHSDLFVGRTSIEPSSYKGPTGGRGSY